jgi:hypothetical protein
MYLWIVRLLTLTPSLSSSPRIRSAPQSLFADAMDRISTTVSGARRDAGRVRHVPQKASLSRRPSASQPIKTGAFLVRRLPSDDPRERLRDAHG